MLVILFTVSILFVSFCLYMLIRTRPVFSGGDTSTCANCSFPLKPMDRIPVISWIILRGHCRYCHSTIPFYHFLIEISGLALFVTACYFFGTSKTILLPLLFIISWCDLKTGRIPTFLVFIGTVLAIFSVGFDNIFIAITFYLIGLFLNQYGSFPLLGRGDVNLIAMSGLWLNFSQIPLYLTLAGLAGIMTAFTLRQRVFPFGPALCLSLAVCVLVGKDVNVFEDILRLFVNLPQ